MSLFQRIFLWFWLAAALLAVSFFLLGRLSGEQSIEQTRSRLLAQAEVVAGLWQQKDQRNTMHWLFQQSRSTRPSLVDIQGQSPFQAQVMMGMNMNMGIRIMDAPLSLPIHPGLQLHNNGFTSVIVVVPKTHPPLFLVQQIKPGQLQRLPISWWLLVAVVIITLISWLLARTLSKRLQRLRQMAQLMADGDLSSRADISGSDEVSALAQDFNRMAEYVQSLLTSQRQLVSDVSHELRSPLARLRIALELAERAEQAQPALSRIGQEADELEHLVSDLLSLARIESGQLTLEQSKIDLCALLQRIIVDANFEGDIHGKSVHLQGCEQARLTADPVLLRSALENVIRNALRYSPHQGKITVTVRHEDKLIRIQVDDQGPGVAEPLLGTLFEPFARIAKARDRHSGGFGLGLAITGRVIQAHGGEVWAENCRSGGLRIVIELKSQ